MSPSGLCTAQGFLNQLGDVASAFAVRDHSADICTHLLTRPTEFLDRPANVQRSHIACSLAEVDHSSHDHWAVAIDSGPGGIVSYLSAHVGRGASFLCLDRVRVLR